MAEDRELISRVAAGDEAAFRQLYERYGDRVFRYALTLVRNLHLAEEVVQETMVAIWRGAGSFKGGSRVSTWIFGIARNQAHALLRREVRGERVPEESLTLPDPAEAVERENRVLSALAKLPPDQREVVVLAFYEGLSYREIARLLGVLEGTVKSRMHFAKRKLREALT
ncbi:MAG TPA: RNA polymerase sigma factor [Anaerolineales bacterium]|nr:RNA polymerase sigma factor [Anaerolineales bacterium]